MDALSTIILLTAIEARYPGHAVRPRLSGQCPLSPRETGPGLAGETRLPDQAAFRPGLLSASQSNRTTMGLMHRHITHNKCYATFREFSTATLTFLRDDVTFRRPAP